MALKIIESNVQRLRDPFVLAENGVYYMYGTDWECYKSNGDLEKWEKLEKEVVAVPENYVDIKWAPEVHKYNGAYYMFTTYQSSERKYRGCTVLKASSPEGPFVEISDGPITPREWSSIDGTLYIDGENKPWMVFVHEWRFIEGKIGRMAAARLSDDFTRLISEPIELFRADDPKWAVSGITDGCFMYRTKEGKLLMLWSNFEKDGYCVALAESDNGEIDGKWTQNENLLFSKAKSGNYPGGHGMIFEGFDGRRYLSIHSPNGRIGDREEKPIFIPVEERNGELVGVCE